MRNTPIELIVVRLSFHLPLVHTYIHMVYTGELESSSGLLCPLSTTAISIYIWGRAGNFKLYRVCSSQALHKKAFLLLLQHLKVEKNKRPIYTLVKMKFIIYRVCLSQALPKKAVSLLLHTLMIEKIKPLYI